MIIAKDEIIYDDEEQKEEVEAETAKSENTEEEYLKRISEESQKLEF